MGEELLDTKIEIHINDNFDEFEIIELSIVEHLAEHVRFCEIDGIIVLVVGGDRWLWQTTTCDDCGYDNCGLIWFSWGGR